jgi:hypothetical protein
MKWNFTQFLHNPLYVVYDDYILEFDFIILDNRAHFTNMFLNDIDFQYLVSTVNSNNLSFNRSSLNC